MGAGRAEAAGDYEGGFGLGVEVTAIGFHPNPWGVAAVAGSVAAFALTYSKLKQRRVAVRLAWLAVFLLLSVPTVLFAVYYTHMLPERAWFYEFRSWPGTELFGVFVGAAGGICATCLPRPLLLVPFLGALGLTAIPYVKPMIGPLPELQGEESWREGVCLQSTVSTCGPATVTTILSHLGVEAHEGEIARAAHSYSGGTEAWYLARYLRRRGFRAEFQLGRNFSDGIELPAMTGVNLGGAGHFVALFRGSNGRVIVADPLVGSREMEVAEFERLYRPTGFYLQVAAK